MKQISKDQRIINILSRAIKYGFELDAACPLAANIEAAEETLIEEVDYDLIDELGYEDRTHSYIDWNDGKGYSFSMTGEFINAGRDRDKNEYYQHLDDGSWKETKLHDHNPGDIIYVRMMDVVDSNAQVVALVAKYEV